MNRLLRVLPAGKFIWERASQRFYSTGDKRGLVLGVYQEGKEIVPTNATKQFDQKSGGRISQILPLIKEELKPGKSHVLLDNQLEPSVVALVGLGSSKETEDNLLERRNEQKEVVRIASAAGVSSLRDAGCASIEVDDCGDAMAAAEGASLVLFSYDELKNAESRKKPINISPYGNAQSKWDKGITYAAGQNFARRLTEAPASHMTPTLLAQEATRKLNSVGVKVVVKEEAECRSEGMNSFLSVAKGSSEPPVFIHATYCPEGLENSNPVCLIGKGITFDSGGLCLKNLIGMDLMKGDMGGSAVTLGTLYAIAALKLPIHVQAFVPSCENMPSKQPNRPGDVVHAMNGKSIQVIDTDYEGRLILADALCYAQKITQPRLMVDMATLTYEVMLGLGSSATAAYTASDSAWQLIEAAGQDTGDRMWRMPLWKHYTKQMTDSTIADINNVGTFRDLGGSCTAAAFLKEFVQIREWIHLDIAGVFLNKGEIPYFGSMMTGRPTRTLVKMAEMMSSKNDPSLNTIDDSLHSHLTNTQTIGVKN